MTVLGRRTEDIDEFMEKLEATGAFDDVVPAQQETTEEGLHRLLLETVYTGAQRRPPRGGAGRATPACRARRRARRRPHAGAARARRARKGGPMTDLRRIVFENRRDRLHPRRGAGHQRGALCVWWCIRWRSGSQSGEQEAGDSTRELERRAQDVRSRRAGR